MKLDQNFKNLKISLRKEVKKIRNLKNKIL